jgi:hypothetical protein
MDTLVPYVKGHINCGDIPLGLIFIGQTYMVGTSNKSVPKMAIDHIINDFQQNFAWIHPIQPLKFWMV